MLAWLLTRCKLLNIRWFSYNVGNVSKNMNEILSGDLIVDYSMCDITICLPD